jgi:L-amino acid N-acyltransferase YncA
MVAVSNERVVGFAYAASYRPRSAYTYTVEDSAYVMDGLRGRAIGSALLAAVIERCESGAWQQMIAVAGESGNVGSVAVHTRLGFHPAGTLKAVGFKFSRWVDSVLMQRALGGRLPAGTDEIGTAAKIGRATVRDMMCACSTAAVPSYPQLRG